MKLLEPIDEVVDNINNQILYLEVVNQALLNDCGGITRYQNKACKELFSQGKSGKSRSLMLFGVHQDKPVITFYKEDSLKEYLQRNPSL